MMMLPSPLASMPSPFVPRTVAARRLFAVVPLVVPTQMLPAPVLVAWMPSPLLPVIVVAAPVMTMALFSAFWVACTPMVPPDTLPPSDRVMLVPVRAPEPVVARRPTPVSPVTVPVVALVVMVIGPVVSVA